MTKKTWAWIIGSCLGRFSQPCSKGNGRETWAKRIYVGLSP
jgi:hypothetical protein